MPRSYDITVWLPIYSIISCLHCKFINNCHEPWSILSWYSSWSVFPSGNEWPGCYYPTWEGVLQRICTAGLLSVNVCTMLLLYIHSLVFSFCILLYLISYTVYSPSSVAVPTFFAILIYLGGRVCWPGHSLTNIWNLCNAHLFGRQSMSADIWIKKESKCQPMSARVRIM